MTHSPTETLSPVERQALKASPLKLIYPQEERIPVITVPTFPGLGKLAALRFIEWIQEHPEGVVALPTGKTPEYFIHWVTHLLRFWEKREVLKLLDQAGIDSSVRPETKGIRFVQIDEFYPIQPQQKNSFLWYVTHYYLEGLGFDPNRALLINCEELSLRSDETLQDLWPNDRVDLSLRTRKPVTRLEAKQRDALLRIDDWCQERENEIRSLGGIGFFMGGIGPDGHIGFNVRGSDHHSTTRLTETNYETQAAAAADLGGIENARSRLVVTLGLGTIAYNSACVALILAAGEAKARVVADAVLGPKSVKIPSSALRTLPQARLYITLGAGRLLPKRQQVLLTQGDRLSDEVLEKTWVDLALRKRSRLRDLTPENAAGDELVQKALKTSGRSFSEIAIGVERSLITKIEVGTRVRTDTRFLHVEPHHDDLMLGYLPWIVRHVRDASNDHHFLTLTSGFTAVTNRYMLQRIQNLEDFLFTPAFLTLHEEGYFEPGRESCRNRDVWQYLDGIAGKSEEMRKKGASRRFLRDIIAVYGEKNLEKIQGRLSELTRHFEAAYPGQKDPEPVQRLKGMCREWEAECLWGYFGWRSSHIHHLRLGFYTGDLFNPEPTVDRDVRPILDLMVKLQPEIVSVALDPEASGPDTHYKALQAVNEATRRYREQSEASELRIWGYRNVWYRFHPSEANVFIPVSLNMFSIMESAFLNTFVSQRDASFPSPDHDGPFCELAQRIQVEQYQVLKICLGREWFAEHPSALIRGTRGFVFLREMQPSEFSQTARRLQDAAQGSPLHTPNSVR